MKNILFLFVLFTSCTFAQVQDYNLRIGSGKDPDSTYCLLTATTGSNFAGRGQFKSLPQLATLLQPFLSGGGLSDGDKGDITVSGSGATWNIDANTIGATELSITGVIAGSYSHALFTVDADGRITSATGGSPQAIQNTSDATSHTQTLSGGGGTSTQYIEGIGIGLATGGTLGNGTVTISTTAILPADTAAMLDPYPLDINVVHKTGDETVAGEKTFTDSIKFDRTGLFNTPSYLFSADAFQSGYNAGKIGLLGYASDNVYGTKKNQVFAFGVNPLDSDDSATGLYYSIEDHYRPAVGNAYGEIHLVFNDSSDVDRRITTLILDKLDPTLYKEAHYIDQLELKDPRALGNDSTYFRIEQVDMNQSQLLLLGAGGTVSGGTDGVAHLVNRADNNYIIRPYGNMPSTSEIYTNEFNITNVNKLRIQNDFGTSNGSSGQATSIIGREGSYGGVVGVSNGWGWDLASGALVIDSTQVGSQYDILSAPSWYKAGTSLAPTSNTDDIYKSSGKVGIGETTPSNRLEVVSSTASDDESILRLSGGSSGFSGGNESGNEHSIVFDLCAFNGSAISQQEAGMIGVKKESTWNEADAGMAGIKSSLTFKTQGGTVASPSLTEKFRIESTGKLNASQYDGTPITGTPFGWLTHETDGDIVSVEYGVMPTATPASASATGVAGTIAWDANYIYVCTATNTWKRVAIATW